ncbi:MULTISPECIES: flagellar basal body rod protein FlgB [Acidithiobacillus]|jgi:flagellar basal-body rod protein FlgB|uniref:Flagellar basal body rod protein FlgB n=3 Tax=Acidithiobacillus caldus TaxID=33059 RepID=F9ZN66_ACICS|nr:MULTISPECIES: flagellar basal body rod protein FlgB [Acidithiobacillus]AEK58109.1 Flagellar basal-body rod protein flgB [Acidithiobacillus caldus SM-1]AIA55099.1 Flagellar basal-body rod protein FlgB [Acidithiobacillus caldus ATCC 51756]AUW32754.1 flagellar basal body rod protein FlgB [Acidithiobacillus caldus]MBU2730281.1 flagellar basal body rod protein FlgB [Acidithiobacillus caldus]MBU2734354.1 flagellar basal body rod protein FlgB [Acidithiobacillus caldus ATCC 51756]
MTSLLDQTLDPLADALKVSGYRQQLLAANIANANTPNYRAVDIPFAKTLAAVQRGAEGSLPMKTDSTRQFSGIAPGQNLAAFVQYQRGNAVGLDGNSVDMDREQASFLKNSIGYQADVTFLTGKIKTLLSAITGTTQ